MKKTNLTIFAFAFIVLAACKSKRTTEEPMETEEATEELVVEKDTIQGDTLFLNKKPAFSFAIDSSWHVMTDAELDAIQQEASHFVQGKAILDGSQSVVVFMAKQFETGVPLDINDSFMCAVNGHDIAGEHFDDPADYFDYIQRMYQAILPADMVSQMVYKPAATETINNKKFDMLEMEIQLDEEKSLVERHYVHFDEKYILDFTVKFSPQEEHEAVLKMLHSISLK